MGKRALNFILTAALLLSLTACGGDPDSGSTSAPPDGSVSTPDTPPETPSLTLPYYPGQSLHPILSDDRVNRTLSPLLYEGLFRLAPSFSPVPVLCRYYSISADGLTWTFTLREDVTFSDGTPLTASIAAHSLSLARSGPYSGRFSCISAIAADEEGRLVITLNRPNYGLPALLDIPIVLDEGDQPLGTGPYVRSGQRLTAREGWWQGTAMPYPTIDLFPLSDPEQLRTAFDEQTLSVLNTDPTSTAATGFTGVYDTVEYDTTSLIYLGFNTDRRPLHDPQVRTAISAALDRSTLVSTAWSGHARAATLPIHPASPLHDPSLSLSLSGDLRPLEQLGLDGTTLSLVVCSDNAAKLTAARFLARQLDKAGITVQVRPLDWNGYLAALNNGQFDLYLGECVLTADFDLTALLAPEGRLNYGGWNSATGSSLLSALLSAPEDERQLAAADLCAFFRTQTPIAPLCFKRGCVLTQWGSLSGLSPTRDNVFYSWFSGS